MSKNCNGPRQGGLTTVRPITDIVEREDGYYLYLDLPGVEKEDLLVESQGRDLLIEALAAYGLSGDERLHNLEFTDVRYQARFTLMEDIDRGSISAELRNGVLTVFMPKRHSEPERISIQVT